MYEQCSPSLGRSFPREEELELIVSFILLLYTLLSDVGLYNRLTMRHEFHVLDKASKDKVMAGSTSGVNFLLLPAKRQWWRHSLLLIVLLSHISFPF